MKIRWEHKQKTSIHHVFLWFILFLIIIGFMNQESMLAQATNTTPYAILSCITHTSVNNTYLIHDLSITIISKENTQAIQFWYQGSIQMIQANDTIHQLNVNSTANSTHTLVQISLAQILLPSESSTIQVHITQVTTMQNEKININTHITFPVNIDYATLNLEFPNTYNYYVYLPSPLFIKNKNNTIQITWVYMDTTSITCHVLLEKTPSFLEVFTINPSHIVLEGQKGSKISFPVIITNHALKTLSIQATTTASNIQLDQTQFTIQPGQQQLIQVQVTLQKTITQSIVFTSTNTSYITTITIQTKTMKTRDTTSILIAIILIMLIITSIMITRKYLTKKRETSNTQTVLLHNIRKYLLKTTTLDHNEKLVINSLLEKNNVSQQDLATTTTLSNATISRTIAKLETKNIITKERKGMKTIIDLHQETLLTRLQANEKNKQINEKQ